MPAKPKVSRIPKVRDLIEVGVPAEAVPTYCALTDYANNKTGLRWPKTETLARALGRSVRTIQSHLLCSRRNFAWRLLGVHHA